MVRFPVSLVRFTAQLAPQDWLVFAYLVGLNLAGLLAPGTGPQTTCAIQMGSLLAFFLAVLVLVRRSAVLDGFCSPLLYRVAIQGTVQTSYFFFGAFLPMVNPRSLDALLYRFDTNWFGVEPAVSFDAIINPWLTEWFAFFYFCYFLILTLHTLPILLLVRRERLLGEFTLGMLIVFCVGHTLYMVVPGFGPHRAIPAAFATEFPHGLWLDTVMATVQTGGAQKDIFPSIHTAAPTFIALFSFRHRKSAPYRTSWPIMFFFAANVVIATMFLRWHWLIDVVAGLSLATLAYVLSVRITDWELRRRRRAGLSPSWPLFHAARESKAAG